MALWLGSITFLLFSFSFYWFAMRPAAIRRNCEAWASSKNYYKIAVNNAYRQCLVRNGMSPESIYVNLQ